MRGPRHISSGWISLLLLLIGHVEAASQPNVKAVSTCPYRTINYITHSLPQQCHKSSWSSPTATPSEDNSTTSSDIPSSTSAEQASIAVEQPSASTDTVVSSYSDHAQPATTTSVVNSQATVASPSPIEEDTDSGSELGNANFLSFEEWKKQNLAKVGQSAEHLGKKHSQSNEHRKRPTNIHNSLDSLGDDAEIDLNFGFAAERLETNDPTPWNKVVESPGQDFEEVESTPRAKFPNKDAGTTCKERFNYASFDCAATVLKTNPQASGATAVLVEKNKDSYMLNECSAKNKFIIIELCDDIAIDTIVLANFEFFSSTFRTFKVSVSDRYPVKGDKWKTLGTYEARNSREIQAFMVENPMIWSRYVRIEFLTHYGSEFYCPVSLLRVHGTTMMEDYRHDEESAKAEDEYDDESLPELDPNTTMAPSVDAQLSLDEKANESSFSNNGQAQDGVISIIPPSVEAAESTRTVSEPSFSPIDASFIFSNFSVNLFEPPESTCAKPPPPTIRTQPAANTLGSMHSITSTKESQRATDGPGSKYPVDSTPTPSQEDPSTSNEKPPSDSKHSTTPSRTAPSTKMSQSEHNRSGSSSTQPHAANPTIQESFFKSVQKRLQMLESNSSLSLQYIEEQSRVLREAFGKFEQKQMTKTTGFLNYLNVTVLHELRDFRQQYDQIWQSTVIELETQREQYQREVLAMNTRLGILADEVLFQKRMSILQSILVLLCLGLVLFSRGAVNSYLELPIVQNVMARSPSFRTSPTPETPTSLTTPTSTGPFSASRQKSGSRRHHRRGSSDDFQDETGSPSIIYSPPTPVSHYDDSETEQTDDDVDRGPSPVPSFETIERPRSSPGILIHANDESEQETAEVNDHAITTIPNGQPLQGNPSTPLDPELDEPRGRTMGDNSPA